MGADLLIVAARREDLAVLHARVDETHDQLIADGWENAHGWRSDDVAEMRGDAHAALEDLFNQRRRDVDELLLDGTWWWVTGGMSWGDDPTDAWGGFTMLLAMGVLDAGDAKEANR